MYRRRPGPGLLALGRVACISACTDPVAPDLLGTTGSTGAATSSASSGASTGGAAPSFRFVNVTTEAGLDLVQGSPNQPPDCVLDNAATPDPGDLCSTEQSTGAVAVADFDRDGDLDLYFTRMLLPDALYANQGDGTFVDVSAAAGLDLPLASSGAAWVDVDNDHDPDLYVTTVGDTRYYLFINQGNGTFLEEAQARGAALETALPHAGMSVAAGDYDLDGWPDLYVGEWRPATEMGPGLSHARLLRNLGESAPGTFEDTTESAGVLLDGLFDGLPNKPGVFPWAPAFVDLDEDGWPDLALTSDFGTSRLFWNDGDGTFTDGTVDAHVGSDLNGMGSTFGDFDGDGRMDWFVSAIVLPTLPDPGGNRLYRNLGGRDFTDATDDVGVRDGAWGWGAAFFDPDNDGDLDLAMTNGWYLPDFPPVAMQYWHDDGVEPWTSRGAEVGLDVVAQGRGLATLDFDADGDLDLVVANNAGLPTLYRNDGGNDGAWLRVRLEGTTSTAGALGAKVSVQVESDGPTQVRLVGAASHYLGQSEPVLHFGLGPATTVHAVEVRWPSGKTQAMTRVPADATVDLVEP